MRVGLLVFVLAVGALEVFAGLRYDHVSWLNPAEGESLFRWIGAAATAVAAVCAAALARRGRSASRVLLAVALAYLAFDQALDLHKRFGGDLDVRVLTSLDWNAGLLVANMLLLAAVGLLLVVEVRSDRRRPPLVAVGTALLVTALGARFGGAVVAALHGLPSGQPRVAGEAAMHACALSGWLLVAAGFVVHARPR